MAWLVACPNLDFSSGRSLRVPGSSPEAGSVLSTEFASLSPSAPLLLTHTLSAILSTALSAGSSTEPP